jgi:hypothetical protein
MEKAQLKILGGLFHKKLKDALLQKYPFAPGFKGDAYGKGRNKKYSGSGPITATGSLLKGIDVVITDDSIEVYLPKHWRNVDEGRKPGTYVPIKPLQEWAKLKLGLSDKEAKSAAFGISKNIYKFGVRPTYFYSDALDGMEEIFDKEIPELMGLDIEDLIDNLLEKTLE